MLPEEEWERYHGELERKTGETCTRVAFLGEYLGHNREIRHSVRDESGIEPTHHA